VEYEYLKELFENSFLTNQLKAIVKINKINYHNMYKSQVIVVHEGFPVYKKKFYK